jgi:hypothetical protein
MPINLQIKLKEVSTEAKVEEGTTDPTPIASAIPGQFLHYVFQAIR